MLKIRERGCIRHVSKRAFNQKWKDKGYEIVEDLDAKEEVEDVEEEDLSNKTVEELRDMARELELTNYYSLNKAELIAEIEKVK